MTKIKRLIALWLVIAVCVSFGAVTAGARFGTGYTLAASEVRVVKTGLFGEKLTFSDTDFKKAYAISDFKSVVINSIPKSSEDSFSSGTFGA